MDAREIFFRYVSGAVPKVGEYSVNEEMALKLLSYCSAVAKGGAEIRLATRELVNNHVPNWEMELKLEEEVANYNCSFFLRDKIWTFLNALAETASQRILGILKASPPPSSGPGSPPSTN